MARKPTLSPTKITTYLACPVKYKWTYVDDRGKWLLRSKSYYSFGSSLHKVLQRFHDSGDAGVTTSHQAAAALEESWIDAGYSSQEEMNQSLAEGKQIIESYVEAIEREPVTAETILIEKMLRLDLGDFVLIGRVDRVDQAEDGSVEVIDYKSGRSGVTDEEVGEDLAMNAYQLMLRDKFPGCRVSATIIALRAGARASAAMTDDQAAEFEAALKELGAEILNRDYEALEPVPKSLCTECDFLLLCQKHPDFELTEQPE